MTTAHSGSTTPATPARNALYSDRRFQYTLAAFFLLSLSNTLVRRHSDLDLLSGVLTGLFVVTAVSLAWQFGRARR
ncbi:hypothetical protein ACFOWE_21065 [Planomonospora corallina]|uniref:Uncharacterized protein n=1 Tax=Planomonospora corallina TaxID=1806052 RepID=A0ABV8IA74_9ACTN